MQRNRLAESLLKVAGGRFTDEYARMLQKILNSGISPTQAYCIGVATVYIVESLGKLPSKSVLLKAAKCERIPEAISIGEAYIGRYRKSQRMENQRTDEIRKAKGRQQKNGPASKPAATATKIRRRRADDSSE